jgi:hypothetical protein
MAPQLTQAELDRISDNALDCLIEATMSADFDGKFNALMGPIACRPDTSPIFLELEAEINSLAIQIAEAAFAKGYKYGYSSAMATSRPDCWIDLTKELRHSLTGA